MQRVGQSVLDVPGGFLPGRRVVDPIIAGGDVGPDANAGQPLHQRVDVALGAVEGSDLAAEPIRRHKLALHQMGEYPPAQPRVGVIGQLAEVRDLAGFPQQPHRAASAGGQPAHLRLACQGGQRLLVARVVAPRQAGAGRRCGEAEQQRVHVGEIEVAVPPCQLAQSLEAVRLDLRDHGVGQWRAGGGGTESAVAHATAGAAGDLAHLGWGERTGTMAVELRQPGEGDMVHVHVEPHADSVGGDQEVDFFFLVERHLGVARARTEPAHYDGAAATTTADRLGDGVDFARAERDDGRARRQLYQLRRAAIG